MVKKILKSLFLIFLITGVVISPAFATAGIISGQLLLNSSATPEDGNVTFFAYPNGSDTQVITEDNYSSGTGLNKGYMGGYWYISNDHFDNPTVMGGKTPSDKVNVAFYYSSGSTIQTGSVQYNVPSFSTSYSPAVNLSVPTQAIIPPSGLGAMGGPGRVDLTWPNTVGLYYNVYRSDTPSGANNGQSNGKYNKVNATPLSGIGGAISYSDIVSNPGDHWYIVVASTSGGTNFLSGNLSGHSDEILATSSAPPAAPTMQISPTTLNFSTTSGVNPQPQTFTILNYGGSNLDWSATTNQSWLTVIPTSNGSLSPNNTDTVQVRIDATGLAGGNLSGDITISSSAVATQTVHVNLTVVSLNQIQISPTIANLYDGQQQTFTITAIYSDGSSKEVTASLSASPDVAGASTSGNTYTAPSLISADTPVTITANYQGKSSPPATITLLKTVLSSISINPNGAVLNQGDLQPFTVSANYNSGKSGAVNSSDVVWHTGVGTITSGGVFSSDRGGNGTVTATYTYNGGAPMSAYANVLIGFSQMYLRVENSKANVYAKDTAGNEFPVNSYDPIVFTASGTPDGNKVASDGTLTEGTKEGPYTVSASVVIAGRTFTPNGVWNINKGAPVAKLMIGNTQVSNDSIIASKPTFTINVTDGNGVKTVRLFIDGTEIAAPALSLTANDAAGTSVTASYAVATALAVGNHTIRIETEDNLGTQGTIDITGLKVYDVLQVSGTPMNYPNPFKPSTGVGTTIHYILTQPADIKLMIYDLAGRPVYTVLYPNDPNGTSQGGKAGDNNPTWNGKDFNGKIVPNGVYTYFITSGGKVLASGKIAVYD